MSTSLGQVVQTAGVAARAKRDPLFGGFVHQCLARHASGDWGDLCAEDAKTNDEALHTGGRVMSSYDKGTKQHIWIVTEPAADDGSNVTTILFPEEY